MNSATAPETQLAYGNIPKIPNTTTRTRIKQNSLDTFQLRPGPPTLPHYHDFHTLQIAVRKRLDQTL